MFVLYLSQIHLIVLLNCFYQYKSKFDKFLFIGMNLQKAFQIFGVNSFFNGCISSHWCSIILASKIISILLTKKPFK